jgi:hypothetical protein
MSTCSPKRPTGATCPACFRRPPRSARAWGASNTGRLVEFQLVEDYPKVKLLLAEFFRAVPHCYLQEIRFDRKDPKAAQTQVHLKLALVYDDSDGSAKK